jgi:hypothetical protein
MGLLYRNMDANAKYHSLFTERRLYNWRFFDYDRKRIILGFQGLLGAGAIEVW